MSQGLLFTFPDGTSSRLENFMGGTDQSYFWDRQATALYPSDSNINIASPGLQAGVYTHCTTTQFMLQSGGNYVIIAIPSYIKPALENQVNYTYTNQGVSVYGYPLLYTLNPAIGTINKPISVSRSTSGGTQTWTNAYNSIGKLTNAVDPIGRNFTFTYGSNLIDLDQVTETQGNDNKSLGLWTYNSYHNPTTFVDASGQTTSYTYNGYQEPATVTDALSNVTTLSYDGNGYLTQIQGPLAGSDDVSTFTYDGYGRLYTATDSEGYTLTYSYDAMDRVTQVTYPDGTTDQIVYDRLDAVQFKDRIGRWTIKSFDSMDQLSYAIDPLGRKTQFTWCDCGAMSSLTDPAGNTTTWERDLEGRVITKTMQDLTSESLTYDTVGRLPQRLMRSASIHTSL